MSERVLNLRSTHNAQAARILAPVYILTVNLNQFHVWSQKHLFHLLIESSRFTLTSLWIILHFPGENFFLKQSSSRVTGYVFKRLIKIWEIWINRWLSVLNLCSKAILCAKIAQKYKNSKRQKLLRSCRAQPWPAYWRSPQYLPAMRTFSQVATLHPRIWSKTLLHQPVWHNILTAWIERHAQYFFQSKETRPSGHQKKKTGNGQNFWIASLNAKLLHQSKNNKDILSFLLEMPSFLEKKKKKGFHAFFKSAVDIRKM